MFGSKDSNIKPRNGSVTPVNPNAFNSLVQGTVVEGTVRSESDIRVDGLIKGKLFCDAKVVIGPTGQIEGEIRCANAVVEGKFEGTIIVTELLNVRENAVVIGEVTTGKLLVQSGAVFNVTCTMGSQTAPSAKSSVVVSKKEDEKGAKAPNN
ncbi:polymer-forming cytoskeletal protein [Haliscomenobacter sp.]|jgi:cytoskeletal protein CcmA (bactofilin family)|uniref:bactofilin family protein n=1 Tax=Haliscomenobacter sp. TaxID=2717303 RepID=UPI00336506D2